MQALRIGWRTQERSNQPVSLHDERGRVMQWELSQAASCLPIPIWICLGSLWVGTILCPNLRHPTLIQTAPTPCLPETTAQKHAYQAVDGGMLVANERRFDMVFIYQPRYIL